MCDDDGANINICIHLRNLEVDRVNLLSGIYPFIVSIKIDIFIPGCSFEEKSWRWECCCAGLSFHHNIMRCLGSLRRR